MTKKEIQKILKERFNIEVTLRPRKATLQRLLKDAVSQSTKKGCSGWHERIEEVCDPRKPCGPTYWKIIPIGFFILTLVVLLPL